MRHCFVLLLLSFLVSCKSKDGDYTLFSAADDVKMGAAMHHQIINDSSIEILDSNTYRAAYQKLFSIRDSILSSGKVLHTEEFLWDIFLLKNDTIANAFCTPGGYIYIYTGLIKFLKSEAELAGIIGHEMAHADMRHSTDQLTKTYGIKVIVALIAGEDYSQYLEAGQSLLNLSFSRSDEKEADLKSVEYLCETPYSATAFAEFFKRMLEKEKSPGMLQFLSTHPNPEKRFETINAHAKEKCKEKGKDFEQSYKMLIESLP